MFNIGMMELLLILLIAFLVVGPKDLPKVARWIARMVKKARDYIANIKDELGLDELAKDVEDVKKDVEAAISPEEMKAQAEELRAITENLEYEMKRTAQDVRQAVEEK